MAEQGFLQTIRTTPEDDTSLLVYSDWLEEQGDAESLAKAEFLRVTVEHSRGGPDEVQQGRQQRLRELAADLEPEWLAVVTRAPIENCAKARRDAEQGSRERLLPPFEFEFLCDRRWEGLDATEEDGVRFCGSCRENVHYCGTIGEAREHAWQGHCVAVDLGVIRRPGDLTRPVMMLGRVSADWIGAEEERLRSDPVSAAREERRQARAEQSEE